jgi:hypothetical protein
MSKKETKQKRKEIPGVSMAELVQRGEMSEFAHLEDVEIEEEPTKGFKEWVKDADK